MAVKRKPKPVRRKVATFKPAPRASLPLAPRPLARKKAKPKAPKPKRAPRAPTAPSISAPSTQATAAPPPAIVPTLPGAQGLRIAADSALAQAEGNRNSGVYQAALNYGDPAVIAQWANLGYGAPISENPTSALSLIGKDETAGLKRLDEGHNDQGTFFSGLRLNDVGKTRDSATAARAKAYQDYINAVAELDDILAGVRIDRDEKYAEAENQEWEAFMASQPEAMDEELGEDVTPTTTKKKPKKKAAAKKPKKPKKPKKKKK